MPLVGVDQEAAAELVTLVRRVRALLDALRPGRVVTHPYEGGHPDHDAAALVVHAALALGPGPGPRLVEMTSYHASPDGALATGEFLGDAAVRSLTLAPAERATKRRMLACFVGQRRTLAPFGVHVERFRPAPAYDFTRPPHEGAPWYERMGWASGPRWREAARDALAALGLPGAPR